MKTYQDIEDAMVKTGMIREEDRAENAKYDVNEDEATRKKIYEKAEAIISKWKKRKNPIIYWYIWYQSSYKLHYIFSRKY